jgi:hypothetical protein
MIHQADVAKFAGAVMLYEFELYFGQVTRLATAAA